MTQEYEMIVEEGTRAEQLAKQQKNLKQRYKGNLDYAQYPSWHCWCIICLAEMSSCCQRAAQPVLTIVVQARAERQDGGSYGHK